ncbi:protein adenylyltransferase SelO family protein [Natrarchaeobaculum sulfurireducens]|uniref:protein adenylyltransferase SelO family protein n=1 Tax=Natrarchaeobaculum sulfurireducens TaxID=2044521 RepID=UPI002AA29CDF|nr:protein adenylyltransferase SelO family protein [Natrarchaeobaculum sulfurireducens]
MRRVLCAQLKPPHSFRKVPPISRRCHAVLRLAKDGCQQRILQWNLERFAEALQPLCKQSALTHDELKGKLDEFENRFAVQYYTMMRKKLGINSDAEKELVDEFLEWLRKSNADYTNTFLELEAPGRFDDPVFATAEFEQLREKLAAVGLEEEVMQDANPRYIPRNYLVEKALDEYLEAGDLSTFEELLTVLENPYTARDMGSQFQQPPRREFDATYTTYCNT